MTNPILPNYYKLLIHGTEIKTQNIIEAAELNFALGNVIKYVIRAGLKKEVSKIQDLRKARQYLDFELERLSYVNSKQN